MSKMTGESQYLKLSQRIIAEGVLIPNERTDKGCLTVINADFEYDCSEGKIPLITTRLAYCKTAIAEMLGYLRGYQNADQFAAIGCKTWLANANDNLSWLANPFRKGSGDMGHAYEFRMTEYFQPKPSRNISGEVINSCDLEHKVIDQYGDIIKQLLTGKDNRRLIMDAWHPQLADRACLVPCMFVHTFSILDGTLYLTSVQRSVDVPLGLTFNMVQCAWLLMITAQITGLKPGKVFHKLINCHHYEDQVDLMREQLTREPFPEPTLEINPEIKTLEDLETWVTLDDFKLVGYQSHPAIKYPFAV